MKKKMMMMMEKKRRVGAELDIHLLEYERETYASFFKEQRVRNTTDTYYEYEGETYRRWRLYEEAIFVESNFKWVVWWKKTVLGKYRQERVL